MLRFGLVAQSDEPKRCLRNIANQKNYRDELFGIESAWIDFLSLCGVVMSHLIHFWGDQSVESPALGSNVYPHVNWRLKAVGQKSKV